MYFNISDPVEIYFKCLNVLNDIQGDVVLLFFNFLNRLVSTVENIVPSVVMLWKTKNSVVCYSRR